MCGTAHTLYVSFGRLQGDCLGVISARQVSSCGGDLKIQFGDAGQRTKLVGKVKTVS